MTNQIKKHKADDMKSFLQNGSSGCESAPSSRKFEPTHGGRCGVLILPLAVVLFAVVVAGIPNAEGASAAGVIVCPREAPANVKQAAKEVRRYVYLRTGQLLPIATQPRTGPTITLTVNPALAPAQYRLQSDGRALAISGGSDVAVLHGAYAFAEKLGVRFYLHGDTIPDERIAFALPQLDETHAPLFPLRGLLPFHDFPEGPDWWTREDWLAFVAQTAKLRMNFIGLHTYPVRNKDLGPEPTVWIGLPVDVNPDGTVKFSDYASWYTTAKHQPYGCYAPAKTSSYSFGGAALFPTDDYGSEVNRPEDFPFPKTPAAKVALINRTGAFLRDVFTTANRLGIKTCVGTESPLDIPDAVKARVQETGLKPDDPATIQKLYEGVFRRISRAYPVDWYWLWTEEDWTWKPVSEAQLAAVTNDLLIAHAALKSLGMPFQLATCGWVLGPQQDRSMFDKILPKDVALSCISRELGKSPVDAGFAAVSGRGKWAIPWFEGDDAMTSPQLWVGRMRKDAADALRHGCDGLMGLHWRTRIMGPNIAALARAGWDQSGWKSPTAANGQAQPFQVAGGQSAAFPSSPVAGTQDPLLYQHVRYGMSGYRIPAPDGKYTVVLRFNEPAYSGPGKRVFGVKLQDRPVIEKLDLFVTAGQNAAFDLTYPGIRVTDGMLRVDFVFDVEYPCIAAIEVRGADFNRKINCGGPAHKDFEADNQTDATPRFLPVADFYADWAHAEFGPTVAEPAAAIFARLDGHLPRASCWIRGPGEVAINKQPWTEVASQHAFVDELAALRPQVRGAGNLERFDWWLNTLRFNRAMARLGCARGALDALMEKIANEPEATERQRLARERALPQRRELVTLLADMYGHLLATLHNASELGTICNIEQQSMLRTRLITTNDVTLGKLSGAPLPADAHPWPEYRGPGRLVVLTARTSQSTGEQLPLRIIALDQEPVKSVTVHVHPLGGREWKTIPARHLARAVYEARLPAARDDFEYHVTAETAGGQKLIWPATAPAMNQTVVIAD